MLWLIDVDDTLSRPSPARLARLKGRDHKCLAGATRQEIDAFMDPQILDVDEPTPFCDNILQRTKKEHRMFFTGRCENLRPVTVAWLERRGWESPAGLMRPDDWIHHTTAAAKLEMLKRAGICGPAVVIDDDVNVRAVVREHFPRFCVFPPEDI